MGEVEFDLVCGEDLGTGMGEQQAAAVQAVGIGSQVGQVQVVPGWLVEGVGLADEQVGIVGCFDE